MRINGKTTLHKETLCIDPNKCELTNMKLDKFMI